MKKILILSGFLFLIFGTFSCRKVCDCVVLQKNETISKYTRERDERGQKCSELNTVETAEDGSLSGIRCE